MDALSNPVVWVFAFGAYCAYYYDRQLTRLHERIAALEARLSDIEA